MNDEMDRITEVVTVAHFMVLSQDGKGKGVPVL
jgi:hypothetical protein